MRFRRVAIPSPYDTGQWGVPGVPCPSSRTLAARLDGELDVERAAAVDAHVRACPVCDADFRRLEALSGCLKGWDVKAQGIVPPQRLASRILRDVEAEAGARQRRRTTEGRRAWAAAAVVLLAVGGAAVLGAIGSGASVASRAPRTTPDVPGAALALAQPVEVSPLLPLRDPIDSPEVTPQAFERAVRLANPAAIDWTALKDRPTQDAFARAAALKDLEERLGESPWWRGDRALASFAVRDFDRSRRLRDRMTYFERRVIDTRTVVKGDSARFLPYSAAFPLPVADAADGADLPFGEATAFVEGLYRVEVGASDGSGGLVIRLLSGGTPFGASRTVGDASGSADLPGTPVLDLAEAVKKDRVGLVDDGRPDSLIVDVHGESPVFVPAGELVTGGLVDRVVARGAYLPSGTYRERLSCRPVSRPLAGTSKPFGASGTSPHPTPVGAVAGPALRGLLAGDASGEEIQTLVESLLTASGLDAMSPGASLVRLYAAGSVVAEEARARAGRVPFSAGDRGFVAADADGRFQGVEVSRLDAAGGISLLRRLLAGYLVEAQVRGAHASRTGPAADMAIFNLARKAPPLFAAEGVPHRVRSLTGEEPVTGIALEAVETDAGLVAWSSALLPAYR